MMSPKWKVLVHNGPAFTPDYKPVPSHVNFFYEGKAMKLSPHAEEVAGFYAIMLGHPYTEKEIFNYNFFQDWTQQVMDDEERRKIKNLEKCDFRELGAYLISLRKTEVDEKYLYCKVDDRREKICNFRIEPPGLFRGRGENPKMGKLKKRIMPEDVVINCSRNSAPMAPPGHTWKEVICNPNVSWLASWTGNIENKPKYMRLHPSSKLNMDADRKKYDMAHELHYKIDDIRDIYTNDLHSKDNKIRQRAVALYLFDKLALRAGTKKSEDQADTVGCCTLRVEHIGLHKDNNVEFIFRGKGFIEYSRIVNVNEFVYNNLKSFIEGKDEGDDLFDKLTPDIINKYLNEMMTGLTVKVFRTYKASLTMIQQLAKETNKNDSIEDKCKSYKLAHQSVAELLNHKRYDKKTNEWITSLDSSTKNYVDPRIVVEWCRMFEVPFEEVYTKDQLATFQWAIQKDWPDFKTYLEKNISAYHNSVI